MEKNRKIDVFSNFFPFFLGSGSAWGWTEPNFQVQVQPKAEPNIMFRFRFGAKSAEPEPNRTVASVVPHVPALLCSVVVCPPKSNTIPEATWLHAFEVVYAGPVRSGFSVPKWATGNHNRGFSCPFWGQPQPNRLGPVLIGSVASNNRLKPV